MVLMDIFKQIAYTSPESNTKVCSRYLQEAIEDLAGGMDTADVIFKYDKILYEQLKRGEQNEK